MRVRLEQLASAGPLEAVNCRSLCASTSAARAALHAAPSRRGAASGVSRPKRSPVGLGSGAGGAGVLTSVLLGQPPPTLSPPHACAGRASPAPGAVVGFRVGRLLGVAVPVGPGVERSGMRTWHPCEPCASPEAEAVRAQPAAPRASPPCGSDRPCARFCAGLPCCTGLVLHRAPPDGRRRSARPTGPLARCPVDVWPCDLLRGRALDAGMDVASSPVVSSRGWGVARCSTQPQRPVIDGPCACASADLARRRKSEVGLALRDVALEGRPSLRPPAPPRTAGGGAGASTGRGTWAVSAA